MGKSILLSLWFFVLGVHYFSHLLLANIHRNGIFSAMWRGLPLVVEKFPRVRRFGSIHPAVLLVLFPNKVGDY